MKPGRELDARVADIMGRCGHVLEKVQDHYRCQKCGEEFWGISWREGYCAFPLYSTEIDAAWTVDKPGWLWEFQETSQTLTVELYTSSEMMQRAIRDFPILPKDVVLVRREWLDDKAATYAWLRCLAALEAVGVEIEDA